MINLPYVAPRTKKAKSLKITTLPQALVVSGKRQTVVLLKENVETLRLLPPHDLDFDQIEWLTLLSASLSLSVEEKLRIILSLNKLTLLQVEELIKIFREEQLKFAELEDKHQRELSRLRVTHAYEWEEVVKRLQQAMEKKADSAPRKSA